MKAIEFQELVRLVKKLGEEIECMSSAKVGQNGPWKKWTL